MVAVTKVDRGSVYWICTVIEQRKFENMEDTSLAGCSCLLLGLLNNKTGPSRSGADSLLVSCSIVFTKVSLFEFLMCLFLSSD